MEEAPLVTLVITTFRRATLLPRALASAVRQTGRSFEVLVVNEPTPGDSAKGIVDDFIRNNPAAPVRYVESLTKGISAARNCGARNARGEFVAFLDDDDEFLPKYAERMGGEFSVLDASFGALGAQPFLVGARGYVSRGRLSVDPVWLCAMSSGWMFRKEVFERGIWFDEGFTGFEDWDFALRLSNAGYRAKVVDEFLWVHGIYLPRISEKVARSLSSDGTKEYGRYSHFVERHGAMLDGFGPAAVWQINLLGGIKAGEARLMAKSRAYFLKSWETKFTFQAFVYWISAFFGYYGFMFLYVMKTRIRRGIKIFSDGAAREMAAAKQFNHA
jgi:glycosyltransferase involved in cell wall biosynthesis